jgi:hypothetical protein
MPTVTYKKLSNYIFTVDSTADVVFSSIPQNYKHLMVQVLWRQKPQASEWGFQGISNIGGTTTPLYNSYTRWLGGGFNSDTQAGGGGINIFYLNGDGAQALFHGNGTYYFPDYTSTTKFKTMHFETVKTETANSTYAGMGGYGTGQMGATTAVTSLTFTGGAAAGSQITLYGLA